eukprot:TRINITY_DN2566_c0_g1_i10.p2 TRINITY_DN2566_c0_g1~~TRINITY_DN2566_c0_g1_i10.p2  ORF type:complete len:178 (-),score=23.00 TRINITY_DN2566_c0_g1_i10:167-658(-)
MENSSTQQTIALQQDDRRSKADTQIIEIFPVQNDLFLSPELYDDSPKNTSSIRSQNQIDDISKNKEDGSQQSNSPEVVEKQEGLVQLLIPIGIQFQDDVQENGSYLDELYKQQVGSEVSGNGSEVQETSSVNQDNQARVNKVNCDLSFLNQLLVISMIWVLVI